MRAVRFEVSEELLAQWLHLPHTVMFEEASLKRDLNNPGSIEFVVRVFGDESIPEAEEPHAVQPTITHIREEYKWDWGIKA